MEDGGLDAAMDGRGDGDVTVDPPLDEEAAVAVRTRYCAPLAEGLCAQAAGCGCEALPDWPERSACETALTSRCVDAIFDLAAGLTVETLAIDPDLLGACATRVLGLTAPCEPADVLSVITECPGAIVEPVDLDAACVFPICAEGAGTCADGICREPPGAAEPCGFVCRTPLVCVADQCAEARGAGAECLSDGQCQGGLRCIDGRCERPAAEGAACSDSRSCQAGLLCENDRCARPPDTCSDASECGALASCVTATPRTCQPRRPVGEPCADHGECVASAFCDGSECAARAAAGAGCSESAACADGLGCAPGTSRCMRLPTEGDACFMGGACAEGTFCDLEDQRCRPVRGEDEECESDDGCMPTLFCHFGSRTCRARFETGLPCVDGNECELAAACEPADETSFVCAPRPAEGEPCTAICAEDAFCGRPANGVCAPKICNLLD